MDTEYVKAFLLSIKDMIVAFLDGTEAANTLPSPEELRNQFMVVKKSEQHAHPELSGGDQRVSNAIEKEVDSMKYLTKRKDGRWQGSRVIDGKRVFVYGKTQVECKEKLKKLTNSHRQTKQVSFYKFAIWWLETFKKEEVKEKTLYDYRNAIENHLKINTKINQVTTLQLQNIISALPAGRIRQEVYRLACAVMKKAYELDVVKKDVAQFLDVGKVPKADRRALTLQEQTLLKNALGDDTFSRRVMFYLCTGARPNEISTIKKNEIRPGWIKINGTKTKASVRWVKVSEKLSSMLSWESPEFFKFNEKRFREHLQRLCQSLGIDYNVSVYTLRHTFATNLYILRVPEKDRQTYMGHTAGSAVTNDVYTTFSPDVTAEDIYNLYGDWYPKF